MPTSPQITLAGALFEAEANVPAYLSRNDHRAFANGPRNKWNKECGPPCEHEIFVASHTNQWQDSRPHYWGLKAGLDEIGTACERIAKFPAVQNEGDAWHGYPVSALDPKRDLEHRPEIDLVQRWLDVGLITDRQAARINRGKV